MRIITLLTDFGTTDSYVSAMKGVILSVNPDAVIVDISHQIPPQDIMAGAFVFSQSAPFFPKGTIHIAVVDPGVGGKRRPLLIQTDRYFFIGPDNGIFSLALQREKIKQNIHLTNKDYFLKHISSTFHGRDIFSPVGAYLSLGIAPNVFGKKIKEIKDLGFKKPYVKGRKITGQIIHVDRFGNLITNIDKGLLTKVFKNRRFKVEVCGNIIEKFVPAYSYAKKDETISLIGSNGLLEIAKRDADAGQRLGRKKGMGWRLKKVDDKSAKHIEIVYTFSKEKLKESSGMSVRQRLQWLEEANLFINRTIGLKKRALTDARFDGLADSMSG